MGIVADGSDGHEFGMKSQEFSCGKNFYRDISQILGMYKFDFKSLMNYSLVKKKNDNLLQCVLFLHEILGG